MTFRETLDKHLKAIQDRDLRSLIETLPDEKLTLVMSDGRLVETVREFIELHRGWFEMTTWTMQSQIVSLHEAQRMGCATIHLEYRDESPDGSKILETSYLTLVFALQGDRWAMILDQNTPIRARG